MLACKTGLPAAAQNLIGEPWHIVTLYKSIFRANYAPLAYISRFYTIYFMVWCSISLKIALMDVKSVFGENLNFTERRKNCPRNSYLKK